MLNISKQVPMENIMAKQVVFWEAARSKSVDCQNVVTNLVISRQMGSKGALLAQRISNRLNWKIFGKEIVDYISSNTKVRKSIVELFDEKTRHEMDNLFSSLLDSHTMSNELYIKQLAKTIISIGRCGNAIILGRGSNFILPEMMALKVRIIEDFESRLNNLAQWNKEEINAKKLKKEDEAQKDFVQRFFKKDIADPLNYDITINLSKMPLEAAEQLLVCAMSKKYNIPEKQLVAQ